MRTSLDRFLFAAICAGGLFGLPAGATAFMPVNPLPPALSELRAFRGRIDYVAHADGFPDAPAIVGTLTVRNGAWSLDEHTTRYQLHGGNDGSSIDANGNRATIDDVFAADPLANAWAAALGTIATQSLQSNESGRAWTFSRLRVFVDASGSRLIGISDANLGESTAFVLDAWTKAGALNVPGHLLRLRAGLPDASFTVDDYRVAPASPDRSGSHKLDAWRFEPQTVASRTKLLPGPDSTPLARLTTSATALAFLLALIGLAVVWPRRDVLVLKLCRRLARDPRGWRRAGISLYVEPDGALMFDGMKYRVGPHFYNRAALVQHSALFLRVSAPAVPHVVILPRKFRPIDLGIRARTQRRAAPGFTLIETLVATAFFAAIVLFAIYPTLLLVARADAMASDRERAVVLASNALADEEVVNDYDGGAPQGSSTTTVDGLALTVTVSPGQMHGTSDLDISVADTSGHVLAHLTSWLGAPVNAPRNSGGGPPGG